MLVCDIGVRVEVCGDVGFGVVEGWVGVIGEVVVDVEVGWCVWCEDEGCGGVCVELDVIFGGVVVIYVCFWCL